MRVTCRRVFLLIVPLLIAVGLAAEQSQETRDARTLVTQSIAAMGGAAPASSLAVGRIEITEGSLQETGSIRVLTRGLEETREEIQTGRGKRGRIFAYGQAASLMDLDSEPVSLELAASSRTTNFPLALLAAALNNPDYTFEYVGLETLEGTNVHHIRLWNTFASNDRFIHLAEFSEKDLWLDATSGLPWKILYEQRETAGAAPRIVVGAIYSDYRDVGGVSYPFRIERISNGTHWATITIETVTLNAAVSDADFATR